MTYSIVSIPIQQYIFVVHIGSTYRRELDQAWQAAIADLEEKHWHRLLVDIRAVMNTIPASEMYDFIARLRERLASNIRIALVVREDQRADARFIENVARNRAMNLQFFVNMQPALSWLVKEQQQFVRITKS